MFIYESRCYSKTKHYIMAFILIFIERNVNLANIKLNSHIPDETKNIACTFLNTQATYVNRAWIFSGNNGPASFRHRDNPNFQFSLKSVT